jgi:hypothetical protein
MPSTQLLRLEESVQRLHGACYRAQVAAQVAELWGVYDDLTQLLIYLTGLQEQLLSERRRARDRRSRLVPSGQAVAFLSNPTYPSVTPPA